MKRLPSIVFLLIILFNALPSHAITHSSNGTSNKPYFECGCQQKNGRPFMGKGDSPDSALADCYRQCTGNVNTINNKNIKIRTCSPFPGGCIPHSG